MAGQEGSPVVLQAQRAVFENVLSLEECRELVFILKSCGVVGYRPHVVSCTPLDLIASNSTALVLPLLNAAVRVQQLVETHFKRECELYLEFVGLISWQPGASIGWHSDSNREYLRQRHYSAVCYLNDQGADFAGGTFRFQTAEPCSVEPLAGRVVAYSSGEENTHCVDPVTGGERTTLALWFTADPEHSTEAILLPQLRSALHRALSSAPRGNTLAAAPYPIDPPDTFFVEPEAWARGNLAEMEGGREERGAKEGLDAPEKAGSCPELLRNAARSADEQQCERRCCGSSAKKRKTNEAGASPRRGAPVRDACARGAHDKAAAASSARDAQEPHARAAAADASSGEGSNGAAASKEKADCEIGREASSGEWSTYEGRRMSQERTSDGCVCRGNGSDGGTEPASDAGRSGKKASTASDVGSFDDNTCSKSEGEKDLRTWRLSELGLRFVHDRRRESLDERPEAVTGPSAGRHVSDNRHMSVTAERNDDAGVLPSKIASTSQERVERCLASAPEPSESTKSLSASERRGDLPTGLSEAEANDQHEGPGDDGTVRLQWLDGEAFDGQFRSMAHALQVLYHSELCGDAPRRLCDAAGFSRLDASMAPPDTGNAGSEHGRRDSANVRKSRWHGAGQTASDLWEKYTISMWQRLQEVLEQWSAHGLFGVDCFSL